MDEHFITHKRGAWEIDLSLAKTFFPEGDFLQMPLVSNKGAQSWLIATAGLALLVTGRPKAAEELFIRKTDLQIEEKDWKNASIGYQNLAELQFRTGELEFSRLHLDMKRGEDATRDANEVLKICAWTGFKLYEPEAERVLSKAYLALKELEQAKTFAHSAYKKEGLVEVLY